MAEKGLSLPEEESYKRKQSDNSVANYGKARKIMQSLALQNISNYSGDSSEDEVVQDEQLLTSQNIKENYHSRPNQLDENVISDISKVSDIDNTEAKRKIKDPEGFTVNKKIESLSSNQEALSSDEDSSDEDSSDEDSKSDEDSSDEDSESDEDSSDSDKDSKSDRSLKEDNNLKTENCWFCKIEVFKYKCPGCFTKSCSLSCVRKHKELMNCNGKRNPAKFVAMSDYGETNMLSDYRFLESANKVLDQRLTKSIMNNSNNKYGKKKNKIAAFHGIKWFNLPSNFSRSKSNKTFFKFSTNEIFWDVTWVFCNGEIENHINKIDSKVSLRSALSELLSAESVKYDPRLKDYEQINDNSKNDLNVHFFLLQELQPPNSPKYHKLRGDWSITKNLSGQNVLEFPKIHVVLSQHLCFYDSCT